jgi:hypothetical protein
VHVTFKARADAPPLRALRCRRVLRQALRRGSDRPAFRVCHFSIQNTHVHMLCEAVDAQGLGRGLQGLAIRIAKRLNRALGRRGALWADRYHARILKTPREVRGALVYVLNNSRHHRLAARGGSLPAHCVDPLSSAPYFDGWRERLRWAEGGEPRPVAAPHCWLLAHGWRRHGRISIAEGPAPPGAQRRGAPECARARGREDNGVVDDART